MGKTLGALFEDYALPTDAAIVRQAQQNLVGEFDDVGDDARSWVQRLVKEGADLEEVAAAALGLLANERSIPLSTDLSDELPAWARSQQRPPRGDKARPPRGDKARPPHGDKARPPHSEWKPDNTAPHDKRKTGHAEAPPGDEVEFFIGGGRRKGIEPGPLSHALANRLSISTGDVGRITVGERSSSVWVRRSAVTTTLDSETTLMVHGKPVKLAVARPNRKPDGPAHKKDRQGPGRQRTKVKSKKRSARKKADSAGPTKLPPSKK